MRSAEQIGRTEAGPRPVPALLPGTQGKLPAVRRTVLDNGLTVVAARKPRSPLVEVRLRVPFGGSTPLHAARAELLAATLLLGTGQRDRRDVDAELAAVGGHLDTGVDPQRLLVTGSVLASGLPTLLGVLADCLTGAAYGKDDVLGEIAIQAPPERLADELGDVLFVVANLARRLSVDPEQALRKANAKFERRFRAMEVAASGDRIDFASLSLDDQEAYWQRVKRAERS